MNIQNFNKKPFVVNLDKIDRKLRSNKLANLIDIDSDDY